MATRRKKASTRKRAKQGGKGSRASQSKAKKKTPPKGGSKKTSASKKSTRKAAAKKSARKATPKKRKRKRVPKTRTPKLVQRVQKSFFGLRKTALKKDKLVLPAFTKRKGKLRLRGTQGKERTLVVGDFWENLREGHWEIRANRVYDSLWSEFTTIPPTLYARFTFTVTRVSSLLTAGSPKLVRATKKKVMHWFFSSGLSYSLMGMRHQFQLAWDTLSRTILDAQRDNIEAAFFLEYITCIAYTVKV